MYIKAGDYESLKELWENAEEDEKMKNVVIKNVQQSMKSALTKLSKAISTENILMMRTYLLELYNLEHTLSYKLYLTF